MSTFDPNDPKWKCCCGCHVTTGTKIICIVETIFAGLYIYFTILETGRSLDSGIIFFGCIAIMVTLLPLYGIYQRKAWPIVPYLCLSIFEVIFEAVKLIIFLGMFIFKKESMIMANQRLIIELLGFALGLFLTAWFMAVAYSCYKYLKDIEKFKAQRETLPMVTSDVKDDNNEESIIVEM